MIVRHCATQPETGGECPGCHGVDQPPPLCRLAASNAIDTAVSSGRARPSTHSAVEIRSSDLANSSFTFLTVTAPATEWRAGLLALDSAPQTTSKFGLAARRGYRCQDPDVKNASRTVAGRLGKRQRIPRASFRFVNTAGTQREHREFRKHSAFPPVTAGLARDVCAQENQFMRTRTSRLALRAIAPRVPMVCA